MFVFPCLRVFERWRQSRWIIYKPQMAPRVPPTLLPWKRDVTNMAQQRCDVCSAKIKDKSMAEKQLFSTIYVNLLCFGRVNGNHARVERHRVSGSPADEAATLPFSGLVGQHMLSCVVNIVAIVAGLTSVQFNHIFADNFVGCKAQQTLHARVDVSDVEMSVRHRHQFYGERSNNWSFWIVIGQSLGSN